jgi:putative ABC transport system substrate-binding protein
MSAFGGKAVATPTAAALAMKKATSSIPIVAVALTDPVGLGLVISEAHPGTNLTGILSRIPGLPGKQFEVALDVASESRSRTVVSSAMAPTCAKSSAVRHTLLIGF